MKPVSATDVLRLVEGELKDSREIGELLQNLTAEPALERLFLVLSDDEHHQTLLEVPCQNSAAPPTTDEPSFVQWQARHKRLRLARLAPITCDWPTPLLQGTAATDVNCGPGWSVPFQLHPFPASAPLRGWLECPDGDLRCCRLDLSFPEHWQPLNLVVMRYGLQQDTCTRIRLPESWSRHPSELQPASQKPASTAADSVRPARISPGGLAADGATRSDADPPELQGAMFRIQVNGRRPRELYVFCRRPSECSLQPVALVARDAGGQVAGQESRLIQPPGEHLEKLFPLTTARMHWLEIRALQPAEISSLSPADAMAFTGSVPYDVRVLQAVAGVPGQYAADLSDLGLLADESALVCLSMSEVEERVL